MKEIDFRNLRLEEREREVLYRLFRVKIIMENFVEEVFFGNRF